MKMTGRLTSGGGNAEKWQPNPQTLYTGNVKWCSPFGKTFWQFLKKWKRVVIWPSNSSSWYLPRKMKAYVYTKNLCTDVHSSIVLNYQEEQAISIIISLWIKKNKVYRVTQWNTTAQYKEVHTPIWRISKMLCCVNEWI